MLLTRMHDNFCWWFILADKPSMSNAAAAADKNVNVCVAKCCGE